MSDRDVLLVCIALACMWVGGYATGRGRPVRAVVAWADWHFTTAPRRSPRFWAAAPVVVAAVCCLWLFRPRRSLRNWRAWREHDRRRALPTQTPSRLSDRRDLGDGYTEITSGGAT
ncbi:hypothetical protein H114_00747 [Streptomyces gancidicus BKS 13-15]|uniref:Uncharacterized protein n=1 Tax=Streptomyces gancidicus BKS 13-15 TaxID=1284664 RepID=M3EBM5_STREZ|nr:hypothetical protein [Streptomyces gancidicus]EMF31112.1 hypothetical protein H114_00747 [Streptomyces gancidicus BKS 13-15]